MAGVYKKVQQLQREIGQFAKDKKNPHFKYAYASAEGVNDTIKPLLDKIGLVAQLQVRVAPEQPVPGVVVAEADLILIDAEDGSQLLFSSIGSGTDTGDKHAMKAATAASKYATIAAVFGSSTDDPEADKATDAPRAEQPKKPAAEPSEPIGSEVAVVVKEVSSGPSRAGRGPYKVVTTEGTFQSFDEPIAKKIQPGSIVIYKVSKFGKDILEVKNQDGELDKPTAE